MLVAGTDIGLGHIGVRRRPALADLAGRGRRARNFIRTNDRPDAINQLAGSIARSPFFAGEPIREARLIKGKGSGYMAAILPSGMRAISTDITPETGAGGFILPNDHVDVILSRRDREAEKAAGVEVHTSETILSNVRVLAIDQTVEEKGGQRVVVGKTATLELSQRQAETLVLSRSQWAAVARAAQPGRCARRQGRRQPTIAASARGVNMVRFGVTTTDDAEIEARRGDLTWREHAADPHHAACCLDCCVRAGRHRPRARDRSGPRR